MNKPNTEIVVEPMSILRALITVHLASMAPHVKERRTAVLLAEAVEEMAKAERENAELRAKLADRDSGWYAAERGEPRDESKGVEWLNGWENWAVLEELDTLRCENAELRAKLSVYEELYRDHGNESLGGLLRRVTNAESKRDALRTQLAQAQNEVENAQKMLAYAIKKLGGTLVLTANDFVQDIGGEFTRIEDFEHGVTIRFITSANSAKGEPK